MTEESTVQVSQDNLSKNQWGKTLSFLDFFYKESGPKKELDKNKVMFTMLLGVVIMTALQVILEPDSTPATGKSSIAELSQISPVGMVDVPPVSPQIIGTELGRSSGKESSLKLSGPQVLARPKDLKAIPPGTLLSATLITGASNGLVKAEANEPLRINGDTLIEKGSTFLGQGSSGDERLNVSFNQVVFRDGTFGQVNAVACDTSDKIVGLKGSKVGNKAANIAGAIGLGFLGGFSQGLQDSQGQGGTVIREPSLKNSLLNGTATAALEQSQNLMSEVKNQPNIIEIAQSTPICILFSESR